ncbi:hypothetical protein M7I_4388 [Glarea lozoyensis 74030]|uniref:Ubiquitin-like domain-containing protein n=1 Tax=Glarea lozoyensis (strain ATCC 74030 / MF5533) TaxID=1104152 RepID=H0EP21_GLAL7|nr:hypothetical protein M7I_4388 [Glarea lozoyensis 74030]
MAKGGVFIPIRQHEAMWIKFTSVQKFAVRVWVGGVNAVSGESKTPALSEPGLNQYIPKSQDYIVVPQQQWLNGIADEEGRVSQLVAPPVGSGYSIERQITGLNTAADIVFEIYPSFGDTANPRMLELLILGPPTPTRLIAHEDTTIEEVKEMIRDIEGTLCDEQQLFSWQGVLEDGMPLMIYDL